ncbi:hypothetical protein [Rhizobium sp. 1399]|uniref:hypothetical protein n=1 Tax=Rhizobium sp. 1399 TaxID=2817758 RepID=UPI00285E2D1B|nr:hypothetical protein [Rhizobium sp. 1399]MDR6667994.1 hypothetical protein [Rhizobium sp. 1399]
MSSLPLACRSFGGLRLRLTLYPREADKIICRLDQERRRSDLQRLTPGAEVGGAPAHFMLMGSEHQKHVCREGADDCERIGDMQSCVDACRRCAESCRKMAG